ncbi:MAG: SpoIID/LytB domain-containing protein [Candidatus Melainabacteria bacterium]|nr:SpoIID/LytB domain-containing protein [Candidatus Melainabacteria bacterium]
MPSWVQVRLFEATQPPVTRLSISGLFEVQSMDLPKVGMPPALSACALAGGGGAGYRSVVVSTTVKTGDRGRLSVRIQRSAPAHLSSPYAQHSNHATAKPCPPVLLRQLRLRSLPGQALRLTRLDVASGRDTRPPHASSRSISGDLSIGLDSSGGLRPVLQLPAPRYVAAVVASETKPGWPTEALKAQAILTQTRLRRTGGNVPVVGDSTQGEWFSGLDRISPAVQRAVGAVWGQWLAYNGRPAVVYYHAACGGKTTSPGWFAGVGRLDPRGQQFPAYLRGVRCPYCRWAKTQAPLSWPTVYRLNATELSRLGLGRVPPKVIRWDETQRPLLLQLASGQQMSAYAFWLRVGQVLGWDKLPASLFQLTSVTGSSTLPAVASGWELRSWGLGHGVGLCQWGAAAQARRGKKAEQILRFYFPGAQLRSSVQVAAPKRSKGI